jgi:hypothetical protein
VSDINRLLQRLCDAEIDFVVVGGFAAMLHGSSHLTRDLDVCAVLTHESVAKEAIGRDKDVQAVIQLRAIREKLKQT